MRIAHGIRQLGLDKKDKVELVDVG